MFSGGGRPGAMAPVVFLGGLALLDVLAGRVEVSDHELGPRAWLMHAVFLVTGLLVLASAPALGRQLAGRRSAGVTRLSVGLFGVGVLLGTVTPDPDEPHSWHGLVHVAGFLLVTPALLPAMIAFALAGRGRPGGAASRRPPVAVGQDRAQQRQQHPGQAPGGRPHSGGGSRSRSTGARRTLAAGRSQVVTTGRGLATRGSPLPPTRP